MIWQRVTRTQILRRSLADGRLNSNQSYTSRKVMFLSVTLTEKMGLYVRILRRSLQHNRGRPHTLLRCFDSSSCLQGRVDSINESGRLWKVVP